MKKGMLAFTLVLAVAGNARSAEPPVRVRLATLLPKGTSFHQILLEMREKWRLAPGRPVELTLFTDGTMGGEADMVRRMRVGQLQAGLLNVVGLSEIDKSVTALQNVPMMYRSLEEVELVREKLRPELERRLAEKGFLMLCWVDAGWVRFFSKQPVVLPADAKPLKIFVWSGDPDQVDIMKGLGYQPVGLEPTDILTSLQTGLIGLVPAPPIQALAGQFYGPAPHMLDIKWGALTGGVVIVKKTWDGLPPETQAALLKSAEEAGVRMQQKARAETEESIETMKKRGLKVQSLTPEAEAEWRKISEQVYPQIRGRVVPADMFDEVQRILKEHRAQAEKAGKTGKPGFER